MTAPKIGDRVRATARPIEGKIVDIHGRDLRIRHQDTATVSWAFGDTYDFEVLPEPAPKVGDVIEGREAYEALPFGAVVADGPDANVRTAGGWVDSFGDTFGPNMLHKARTLVYLPGVTA